VCREPYASLALLEKGIAQFLDSISIGPRTLIELQAAFAKYCAAEFPDTTAVTRSLDETIAGLSTEVDNFAKMCARGLISEEQFLRQRHDAEMKRLALTQRRTKISQERSWFERYQLVETFSVRAVEYFLAGDASIKRLILETVGSNSTLKDRILNIEARLPFFVWSERPGYSVLCSFIESIRTLSVSHDEGFQQVLVNIGKINDAMKIEAQQEAA
jgi:hypothetical protein